jgi:hypothetical protein
VLIPLGSPGWIRIELFAFAPNAEIRSMFEQLSAFPFGGARLQNSKKEECGR